MEFQNYMFCPKNSSLTSSSCMLAMLSCGGDSRRRLFDDSSSWTRIFNSRRLFSKSAFLEWASINSCCKLWMCSIIEVSSTWIPVSTREVDSPERLELLESSRMVSYASSSLLWASKLISRST